MNPKGRFPSVPSSAVTLGGSACSPPAPVPSAPLAGSLPRDGKSWVPAPSPCPPSPRPPTHRWPNLRLSSVLLPPAPGVLCGSSSNPANLHNDEALQCRLGLRRVGKKYALSFGGTQKAWCSPGGMGRPAGGRRQREPAARPPRTAQRCHPLSLCPAGPAEGGLPRAGNQQEVRLRVPAPDSGRTDPGHSDRHSLAG